MDLSRFSAAPTARLQIHTISPVPRAELLDVKATLKFNNFLIILDRMRLLKVQTALA